MKQALRILMLVTMFSVAVHARNIELTPENTVSIRTEIDYNSVSEAQLELMKIVAKRGSASYPIYLVLDSPGGSIDAGLNFIETAKTVPNLHTVTLFAASMASAIVEALPGKRYVLETGILMFHRAAGGVQGQFEDGEVESRLTFYKELVRGMEQTNADRMKMTLANYKAAVKDELWILGKNSIKKGAADEIITLSCSQALLAQSKSTSVAVFMFSINVKFNACPMIRSGIVEKPENRDAYLKYQNQKTLRYIWKN